MSWSPSQESTLQILEVLRNTQNITMQAQVSQQIAAFATHPEWTQYLAHILANCGTEPDHVREMAGLLLKNNFLESCNSLPKPFVENIKIAALSVLGASSTILRHTGAILITTILNRTGLHGWPEALPMLLKLLESPEMGMVDGALFAIKLICEDQHHLMDLQEAGKPLEYLLPRLLAIFKSSHEVFRFYAVTCVNEFVLDMPQTLVNNIEAVLQGLFFLTQDPSVRVRQKITRSLVSLTEVHLDLILIHLKGIVQFMLHTTVDADDDLALEACDFWQAVAGSKDCRDIIREFLPNLIPVLLDKMVFSELEIGLIEDEEEAILKNDAKYAPKPVAARKASNLTQEDLDDEDFDEADTGDDQLGGPEWNIRKCAAGGLDTMASMFGLELLPHLIPQLQARLVTTQPWPVQESAILALGAVAEGCTDGLKPYLPGMIPYLLGMLKHQKPMIRSITCWTISRFSAWIVDDAISSPHKHEAFFKPLLQSLVVLIHDPYRKVQEAASSALATLEESAGVELCPYLTEILQTLMSAFVKYEDKNLLIIYDAISTLADSVGEELGKDQNVALLMPPLIQKWNGLPDEDERLFPLLECLNAVATAIGIVFQRYAEPVYARCLKLIERTLVLLAQDQQDQNQSHIRLHCPEKDFIVCSLDLISGMVSGMGTSMESLIGGSNLIAMLVQCCKDPAGEVLQSAFALVGDLARTCFAHLIPALPVLIPILGESITPELISVCNNACWALGEIAIRYGEGMRPFIQPIFSRLGPIINKPREHLHRNLMDNAAICLGRLCLVAPDLAAPSIGQILANWCGALRAVRDDEEKDSATRGLIEVIKKNPQDCSKELVAIALLFLSWKNPSTELHTLFHSILHGFKTVYGAEWPRVYAKFPQEVKNHLSIRFHLN